MTLGYVLVGLLGIAVAVFAVQNGEPTRVQFLAWSLETLPVAGVILLSLAIGAVLVGVPLLIQRWRLRVRIRTLERQLAALEPGARAPEPLPGKRAVS